MKKERKQRPMSCAVIRAGAMLAHPVQETHHAACQQPRLHLHRGSSTSSHARAVVHALDVVVAEIHQQIDALGVGRRCHRPHAKVSSMCFSS
jgi:hypothetical protein